MSEQYVPVVGERGLFTFIDGITIQPDIGYTVGSIGKIKDYYNLGLDLVAEYSRNGLSGLEDDLAANGLLVKLLGVTKNHFVPLRAITSFPSATSIEYVQRIIGINLGILPVDERYDAVLGKLSAVIVKEIGINPELQVASQGNSSWLTSAAHESRIVLRETNIEISPTIGAENERLKEQVAELQKTIGVYEELLVTLQPPPTQQ